MRVLPVVSGGVMKVCTAAFAADARLVRGEATERSSRRKGSTSESTRKVRPRRRGLTSMPVPTMTRVCCGVG